MEALILFFGAIIAVYLSIMVSVGLVVTSFFVKIFGPEIWADLKASLRAEKEK